MRSIEKPGVYYWLSPIFPQAKIQFDRFVTDYRDLIRSTNKAFFEIELYSGSKWRFRGTDKPESIKGDTADGGILDECGTMKPDVWFEAFRPMLAVKKGWCDFIGTPKGPNWFKEIFIAAKDRSDWESFHARSVDSPFFTRKEYEEAKASVTERIFRQEYEAQFLDDDSEVFRGVMSCVKGDEYEPYHKDLYVIGCDVAKHVDWTVILVMSAHDGHVCYFERFQKIDWPMQIERIESVSKHYNNAPVSLDATGVGDPIFDALNKKGVFTIPVKFQQANKNAMIQKLALAIERQEISFPEIPELINELLMFSFERLPSGTIRYGAPQGYHDDCVMALALAYNYLEAGAGMKTLGPTRARY